MRALARLLPWLIMTAAAALEVAGDGSIRMGLRSRRIAPVLLGLAALGLYGITVNRVPWDFSRLMGTYIAVFAVVSILTGAAVFHESIPVTTWLGLALIVAGGIAIQLGAATP